MNTPRQRVENRVNKVLAAMQLLAKCSKHQGILKDTELESIRLILQANLDKTMEALETSRDAEPFKL
jgi:hypothetical protein